MKYLLSTSAMGLAALALSTGAALADYPTQPVNFVVPFPPGDLEDVLTRMIADDFQEKHGVAAAVINIPGGGGGPFPGAIDVASAPPDGSTIGSFVMDVPLIGPYLGIPELDPDPFEPVGIFVTYPLVIATSRDAPYQTMEELAEYARENPVLLAHFGAGLTPTQLTMALAAEMGFEWGGDAAFDAIDCNTFASGDADVGNTTLQLIQPCLDDMTVLTSMTEERIHYTPDAPAIGELVPELALDTWNGLFVHRDTPQEIRDVIAESARETMASERAQAVAQRTGAFVYWMDAEESQARIDRNMVVMQYMEEILGD